MLNILHNKSARDGDSTTDTSEVHQGHANVQWSSLFEEVKMGPTKVIPKEGDLYEVQTGRLVQKSLPTREQQEAFAVHHYIVLPVIDKAGKLWMLDGQPVYCRHGSQYETVDDQKVHLARCPDCGGMGIRDDEPLVESDCIRCVQCGHEFDARLEMMET
jgi:hypothetical protein